MADRKHAADGEKKGLFSRWRKKEPEFDETQDIYYGLKLGSNSEHFKEVYDETGEDPRTSYGSYNALFNNDSAANESNEDDEMTRRFARLQQERRARMNEAAKKSGTDLEDVASEFGVAAPMPVTVYSGDPYAAQYGLDTAEEGDQANSFQSAMMKETIERTQEMNTRILVDRVNEMNARLQQPTPAPAEEPEEDLQDLYHIDESIFEPVPENPAEEAPEETPVKEEVRASFFSRLFHPSHAEKEQETLEEPVELGELAEPDAPAEEEVPAPMDPVPAPEEEETATDPLESLPETQPAEEAEPMEDTVPPAPPVHMPDTTVIYPSHGEQPWIQTSADGTVKTADVNAWYAARHAADGDVIATPEDAAAYRRKMYPEDAPEEEPRRTTVTAGETEAQFVPTAVLEHAAPSHTEYAPNNMPMHMFKADMLQSAVFSEARQYEKPTAAETGHGAGSVQKKLGAAATEEVPEEEPENEFNRPEDARTLSRQLLGQMREYSVRTIVSFLLAVFSLLMTLVCEATPVLATDVLPTKGYLLGCALVLVLLGGLNYKTLVNGLGRVHKMQFNADSAISFAMAGGLLQALSALFFAESVKQGQLHMYTAVIALGIALNTLGKLVMSRRIYSNFRVVSTDETKYAMKLFDDSGMNARMCHGVVSGQGIPAYTRRAAFLADFMDISYAPDRCEDISATLAPIGLVSSLALAIVSFFLKAGVGGALCVFAASLCAVTPFTNMLALHLPVSRLGKYARQNGGVALGSETIEEFGDANAVMLDASDLFPRGSVELHSLRTFSYKRVDKAIVTAAAVINQVGGPLVSVFDQVLEQMKAQLPEVRMTSFENNTGVTAQANGIPVYIGTRGLLAAHNIYVPGEDFEGELLKQKRYPVYVAIGTNLAAMLVVSYKADKQRREDLRRLIGHGCVLMVSTTDGNLTSGMIASTYGLDPKSVRVIPADIGEEFRRRTGAVQPRVSATAATKGRLSSFSRILCRCIEYKGLLPVLVALQAAAVCIGFVLLALLVCFAGPGMNCFVLLLYEILWAVIILLYPRLTHR